MARSEKADTSKSKKMVRKQVYIHPQQEKQLKELAIQYDASEAELVRQAIEMLLTRTPQETGALPVHEASWQQIIAFVDQREQNVPPGKPYKWNRSDAYDDERAQRAWNTSEHSYEEKPEGK